MNLKASYFSLSKPLIIENLRRFWAIPVLSFLVYFFSGIFPILMSYKHINNISGYIELSLNNQQPFYLFAHLLFPVITAVIIFRYLQGISSVSVMHALPFTRMKLYNSSFVSGLILTLSPILLNGLILLLISKPAYNQYWTDTGMMTNKVNLFARADILNWIWVSVVMVAVIYAVSVFAGIVTGNSLMHFAMAGFFNFIIPSLYALCIAYFSHFLYGFDASGNWWEFCVKISPFTEAIANEGNFSAGVTVYYILTFLVMTVLTAFLYTRRKLEHATDSLAFGFMEPIICYLISFLGMTALGFYFIMLGQSDVYMYAGLAAGTLIFFIIGQMIVKKTPRIFNRNSLKSFAIYALIAIVFIVGLRADLTGFEKRVPKAKNIDSFILEENFDYQQKYGSRSYRSALGLQFKEEANKQAAIALHQSILDNRDRFEHVGQNGETRYNTYQSRLYFKYNPEKTFSANRAYMVDYDFFKSSPHLKQLYESKEFKDHYSLKQNLQYERLRNLVVTAETPYSTPITISSLEDMNELMDCLERDLQDQTFEDMVSLRHSYALVAINYTYKDPLSDMPERIWEGSQTVNVTENFAHTIQWLEDHGYTEGLELPADQVEYIALYRYQSASDKGGTAYAENTQVYEGGVMIQKGTASADTQDALIIDDPERIQLLLDTYETTNTNYNDYYYGVVVFKDSFIQAGDMSYKDKNYYEEKGIYDYTLRIYFNEGNIPDFISQYFK